MDCVVLRIYSDIRLLRLGGESFLQLMRNKQLGGEGGGRKNWGEVEPFIPN